jgi:hypothetical protein
MLSDKLMDDLCNKVVTECVGGPVLPLSLLSKAHFDHTFDSAVSIAEQLIATGKHFCLVLRNEVGFLVLVRPQLEDDTQDWTAWVEETLEMAAFGEEGLSGLIFCGWASPSVMACGVEAFPNPGGNHLKAVSGEIVSRACKPAKDCTLKPNRFDLN